MRPETMTRVVALLTESGQWVGPGGKEKALPEAGGALEELLQDLAKADLEIKPNANADRGGPGRLPGAQPRVNEAIGASTVAFRQLAVEHDRIDPQVTSADVLRNLGMQAAQRS